MRISIIATVFVASIFSGCASITTGHNQSVSVETPSCLAATCKLTNDKGTWFVNSTPGSVTVNRAYGDMTVACEKGEAKSVPARFKSSTKGMAFGNIILGGVIGVGVDVATGAAYDYPAILSVDLKCEANTATTATTAPSASVPVAPVAAATPATPAK